jgi:hypothetical protein
MFSVARREAEVNGMDNKRGRFLALLGLSLGCVGEKLLSLKKELRSAGFAKPFDGQIAGVAETEIRSHELECFLAVHCVESNGLAFFIREF